jgi:hypothetical protein
LATFTQLSVGASELKETFGVEVVSVGEVAELAEDLLCFAPFPGVLQELAGVRERAGDELAVGVVLCELSKVCFGGVAQAQLLFNSSHRLEDERRDLGVREGGQRADQVEASAL